MNDLSPCQHERIARWEIVDGSDARDQPGNGLERLHKIISDDWPHPPISQVLGFYLTEAAPGHAVFVCEPGEHHFNPMGLVHGGLAATLIYSATGCAIMANLDAGDWFSTIDLSSNFIRPMPADGTTMRCEGRVIHQGRSIARADAQLVDDAGQMLAYGHATCRIFRAAKA